MKTTRKVVALILVFSVLFCFMTVAPVTYAEEHTHLIEIDDQLVDIGKGVVQLRATLCPNCKEGGMYATCIAPIAVESLGTSSHTPLFGSPCTIEAFTAPIKVHCRGCGYLHGYEYGHTCYIIHSSCGKGRETWCAGEYDS